MALGLAAALRELAESEERWESLAQTAPDYIFSIGPDRRILFINKAIEGKSPAECLGSDIADMTPPQEREPFVRAIERVFRDGSTVRHHVRAPDPRRGLARYDVYLGPVREDGRVVRATAVMRDVTGEYRLATGEPLGEEEKAAIVRSAMSAFDFAPVRELLSSFYELADIGVTIATSEGELYSSGRGLARIAAPTAWRTQPSPSSSRECSGAPFSSAGPSTTTRSTRRSSPNARGAIPASAHPG